MNKSQILGASKDGGYLENNLLIATPNVEGSNFQHSVILMCAHSDEGAMGIIINQPLPHLDKTEIFKQFDFKASASKTIHSIHYGGPVESQRGFVIYPHENKFLEDALITIGDIAISNSIDLLQKVAQNNGPKQSLLALGYAGWSAGQLEEEIEENCWLSVPLDLELIFDKNNDSKWQRAAFANGIDITKLSTVAGHA